MRLSGRSREAVSYTHLDVYKRQAKERPLRGLKEKVTSPFSPYGFAECMKRGVRNGGSASSTGTAAGTLQGKERAFREVFRAGGAV